MIFCIFIGKLSRIKRKKTLFEYIVCNSSALKYLKMTRLLFHVSINVQTQINVFPGNGVFHLVG